MLDLGSGPPRAGQVVGIDASVDVALVRAASRGFSDPRNSPDLVGAKTTISAETSISFGRRDRYGFPTTSSMVLNSATRTA
jgi:hypothetical protein